MSPRCIDLHEGTVRPPVRPPAASPPRATAQAPSARPSRAALPARARSRPSPCPCRRSRPFESRFVIARIGQSRGGGEAAAALKREQSKHRDLVPLHFRPRSACRCAESTHAWFSHALQPWPAARFFGETEDHVYVQTHMLQWELQRLPASAGSLWFGLFLWSSIGDDAHPRTGCWGGQFGWRRGCRRQQAAPHTCAQQL